ncbi:MAG: hypothetical protein ACI4U2_05790, partial [Christensenellaceae bacterium]
MKRRLKNIFLLSIALIVSLVCAFAAVGAGGANAPKEMPVRTVCDAAGNQVNGVSIEDVGGVSAVPVYMHLENEFLSPADGCFGVNEKTLGTRGTIRIVLLTLDPMDEAFSEKSDGLKPYLTDGYNWHFTLYLPPFFGAANVYVNS